METILEIEPHKKIEGTRETKDILIVIDATASKTTPFHVNSNKKEFKFPFEFKKLTLWAETNALARPVFIINGRMFPECYFIDASENFKSENNGSNTGYYCRNDKEIEYPFELIVPPNWSIEVHTINTHTSAQKVYCLFSGNRIYPKDFNLLNVSKIKEVKENER